MQETTTANSVDLDLTTLGHGDCAMLEIVDSGNLSVVTAGSAGATRTITTLSPGAQIPIRASKIISATTTATHVRVYYL